MKHLAILALPIFMLGALPFAAFAAGSDDTAAPVPTQTSKDCKDGEIWDEKTLLCVAPETTGMNDDQRYLAVRELAYAGRPEDALRVLDSMTEGRTDRVLTYLGFANRKAGRLEEGLAYYAQALAQNPDNIQARSYLGQAYVEMNELVLASAELDQIRVRGGAGSWAEVSLAKAVATGQTVNY